MGLLSLLRPKTSRRLSGRRSGASYCCNFHHIVAQNGFAEFHGPPDIAAKREYWLPRRPSWGALDLVAALGEKIVWRRGSQRGGHSVGGVETTSSVRGGAEHFRRRAGAWERVAFFGGRQGRDGLQGGSCGRGVFLRGGAGGGGGRGEVGREGVHGGKGSKSLRCWRRVVIGG